jgi:hypothetical protein
LDGSCVKNDLQQRNAYSVVDQSSASTAAGAVVWNDGDECGDVVGVGAAGAQITNIPNCCRATSALQGRERRWCIGFCRLLHMANRRSKQRILQLRRKHSSNTHGRLLLHSLRRGQHRGDQSCCRCGSVSVLRGERRDRRSDLQLQQRGHCWGL